MKLTRLCQIWEYLSVKYLNMRRFLKYFQFISMRELLRHGNLFIAYIYIYIYIYIYLTAVFYHLNVRNPIPHFYSRFQLSVGRKRHVRMLILVHIHFLMDDDNKTNEIFAGAKNICRCHVTPFNCWHLIKLEDLAFQMNQENRCATNGSATCSNYRWKCDTRTHRRTD